MITVTDKDYLPLPVENRDLEFEALDLAYRVMKCREAKHFALASAYEAKLAKCWLAAEGGSKESIQKVRDTLTRDMARRIRDSKPKLTLIDNAGIDASLALLARVLK